MKQIVCPSCGSHNICRDGNSYREAGIFPRFLCRDCGRKFTGSKTPYKRERVGYLDIETSALNASFGHVISWAIKERKGPVFSAIMRERSLAEEKRILQELLRTLQPFDRVVTYYGTYFDIPFLRTRCIHHRLKFPSYMQLYHTDLYLSVRGRLATHRKRLETVAALFKAHGKTPLKPEVWQAADWGEKWAFDYILKHNIGDVRVLEKVHRHMDPYIKSTRRSI